MTIRACLPALAVAALLSAPAFAAEPVKPAPAKLAMVAAAHAATDQVTFFYYPDLTAPRAFYGSALGLVSYYDQEWVSLYRTAPGATIGIVKSGKDAVPADMKRDATMVSIVTTDVEGWNQRLKQGGKVKFLKEIYDHPVVPIRAFLLQDPGGYSVEFFQWRK